MPPYDKKHKAVRLASRIFATILVPVGEEGWEKARKRAEKVLTDLADQLLEEEKNSPAQKRREKKEKLQELRRYYQKKQKTP
jgi:hypothetical protein